MSAGDITRPASKEEDVEVLDRADLDPDDLGPDDDVDPDGSEAAPVPRTSGIALAVWAAIGLAAAFTLAVERVKLLEDPNHRLSCDLSPLLSCGSVMVTEQARAFGFPNPFLGIGAFSVVLTLGVLLASQVRLPRWVLDGLAVGGTLGLAFVAWLISQSLYSIGALCPWCMVVWSVTIPIFVWTTLLAARAHRPSSAAVELLWDLRFLIVLGAYVLVIVLALVQFWSYWETLL